MTVSKNDCALPTVKPANWMKARSQNTTPADAVGRGGLVDADAEVGPQRAVFGLVAHVDRQRTADPVVDVVGVGRGCSAPAEAGSPCRRRRRRRRHCIRPGHAHTRRASGRCRCPGCNRSRHRRACRSSRTAPALPSQACRRPAPQRPRRAPRRYRGEDFSPSSSQPPCVVLGGIGLRGRCSPWKLPFTPLTLPTSPVPSLSPRHRIDRKERPGDAPLRRTPTLTQMFRCATTKRQFEQAEMTFSDGCC